MGSYATLIRQSLFFAAFVLIVTFFAPNEAKLWVVGVGAVALIFFVVVSIARHRQVVRLAQEVDEVLHSGRRLDFSNYREGDMAVLANELGKMVARLQRTSDQLATERNALSDALADISHQIRTPLTSVGLMLPGIERADDATDRKRLVRQLELMIERLSWLVTALMKIAKVDAGALQTAHQQVSAATVVRRAFAPLEMSYDLHDVALVWQVNEQAVFVGDEGWTAEAIENILKNCMEHTPAGGSVTVTVAEDALATNIVVADSGPGIAPDDLPHVFERFYRGENERQTADVANGGETAGQTQQGFGIGLALAQALISAQGGSIRAANAPEGGACFTVSFPKFVV